MQSTSKIVQVAAAAAAVCNLAILSNAQEWSTDLAGDLNADPETESDWGELKNFTENIDID